MSHGRPKLVKIRSRTLGNCVLHIRRSDFFRLTGEALPNSLESLGGDRNFQLERFSLHLSMESANLSALYHKLLISARDSMCILKFRRRGHLYGQIWVIQGIKSSQMQRPLKKVLNETKILKRLSFDIGNWSVSSL